MGRNCSVGELGRKKKWERKRVDKWKRCTRERGGEIGMGEGIH